MSVSADREVFPSLRVHRALPGAAPPRRGRHGRGLRGVRPRAATRAWRSRRCAESRRGAPALQARVPRAPRTDAPQPGRAARAARRGRDWFFTMELVEGVLFLDWVRPGTHGRAARPPLDPRGGCARRWPQLVAGCGAARRREAPPRHQAVERAGRRRRARGAARLRPGRRASTRATARRRTGRRHRRRTWRPSRRRRRRSAGGRLVRGRRACSTRR